MHDDYDALQEALEAVVEYVDEIVVVDGAYRWIAPFFESCGKSPDRSSPEALRIVDSFLARTRVTYISNVWENELEKRIASYKACTCDYVYLIDADEIHDFDASAFDAFHESDKDVALAASPFYADGRIIGHQPGGDVDPNKPVMFRRDRITAENHLAYLWLVLTPEERASVGVKDDQRFFLTAPIAINHHLSHLRSINTSCNRAAFYNLLSIRGSRRLPWWEHGEIDEADVLDLIRERLTGEEFYDFLRGSYLSLGFDPGKAWVHVPGHARGRFQDLIDQVARRQRLAFEEDRERLATVGRIVLSGQTCYVDVSDWDDEPYEITVEGPVRSIRLSQHDLQLGEEGLVGGEIHHEQGSRLVDRVRRERPDAFRRIIGVNVWWPVEDGLKARMRVGPVQFSSEP